MTTFIGKRITESLGVVNDTTFWRCYWPKLDEPTELFDKGSSGLKVMGSSRNVVWPDDTEFLDYYPDALFPAEQAVMAAFPGQRVGMVELTPEMVEVYMAAYDKAVAAFPDTHAVHSTPDDCFYLRHKELVSTNGQKADYVEYVSTLSSAQVDSLVKGETDAETLKEDVVFWPINMGVSDADLQVYEIAPDGMKEITVDNEGGKV